MKIFVFTLLCLSLVAAQQNQPTQKQKEAFNKYLLSQGRTSSTPKYCPAGGLEFYKECKGSIKQCSDCLGIAEKKCEESLKQSCYDCTSIAGYKCKGVESMCFGDQECTKGKEGQCVNYKCIYKDM